PRTGPVPISPATSTFSFGYRKPFEPRISPFCSSLFPPTAIRPRPPVVLPLMTVAIDTRSLDLPTGRPAQCLSCSLLLANPDKYDFFVPDEARWSYTDDEGRNQGIAHLKTSVGSGLNKALAAVEDANPNTLQDVLKGINFNRRIGQRTLDDSTLVEFIQHFNDLPLGNDDFEFPDLLGAAYEYLIKYFADSAGKKGGEFYTPSEVVRLLVQLIEPKEGMAVDDP